MKLERKGLMPKGLTPWHIARAALQKGVPAMVEEISFRHYLLTVDYLMYQKTNEIFPDGAH